MKHLFSIKFLLLSTDPNMWSIWKWLLTSAHGNKKTNQCPDHLYEAGSWCWFLGAYRWMWHPGPLDSLPTLWKMSIWLFSFVGDECMLVFILPITCALGILWIQLLLAPSHSGLYFPCQKKINSPFSQNFSAR